MEDTFTQRQSQHPLPDIQELPCGDMLSSTLLTLTRNDVNIRVCGKLPDSLGRSQIKGTDKIQEVGTLPPAHPQP